MAAPELTDAEVFGANHPLVYGAGSAVSGQPVTDAQATYARQAAALRDQAAPAGAAANPSYDTPDLTGAPDSYHVTREGGLSDPQPQVTTGLPKPAAEMNDAEVFGPAGPATDSTADARPVSERLGFGEGVHTVVNNLTNLLSGGIPGMKNAGLGVSPLTLPMRLFMGQQQGVIDKAELTQRPGMIGKIGGEVLASAPLAVDALGAIPLGLAQGALTSESKDVGGKLMDTVMGGVGGKLGDIAIGGARKIIAPAIRPAAQWAMDHGISLTPGGIAGGLPKSLETGASKGTIAGPMIGAAQRRGIDDFNIATANHVLEGTGLTLPEGVAPGHEAVNATHNLLSGAFNALAPKLALSIDGPLAAAQSEATNAGTLMPAAYRARMDSLVSQLPVRGGPINGRTVQDLTAQLRQEATDAAQSGDFFAKDYGRAVDKLRSAVEDGLERANPDQAKTLQALRTSWAKQVRVERAAANAVQDGGVFTPKGLLTAVRSTDQSARDNATARGDALMQDWANNGKAVLPDKLPNAGSLWAHLPELAVTYGVGHEAGVPGIAGMLAGEGAAGLLYTKPGQAMVNAALTKRPAGAQRVADILRELQPLLSYSAATAAPKALPAITSATTGLIGH